MDVWLHVHHLAYLGKTETPGHIMGRRQARKGSVILWAVFFSQWVGAVLAKGGTYTFLGILVYDVMADPLAL